MRGRGHTGPLERSRVAAERREVQLRFWVSQRQVVKAVTSEPSELAVEVRLQA